MDRAAGLPVDFLAIGHLTRDLTRLGPRLGGAVAYAARLAERLGWRPGIVTSAGPDLDPSDLGDIPIHLIPAAETTCFENVYGPEGRRQRLLARARPISPADIPPAWRSAPVALLGPVAAEVGAWIDRPPGALTGLGLQGWLREWDEAGHVRFRSWDDPEGLIARADVVFVSEEDLAGDPAARELYAGRAGCLVTTRGPAGCAIEQAGRTTLVAGYPAAEVDPTGAGDVFAAAFLIRWAESGDLREAADFANAAAALSIGGPGLSAIPDRARIARLRGSR